MKKAAPTFFNIRFWGDSSFRGAKTVTKEKLQAFAKAARKLGFDVKIRRETFNSRVSYGYEVNARRAGQSCPDAFKKAAKVSALARKHGVKFHKQAPVTMIRTTPAALKRRAAGWGWKGITKCPVKGR